MDEVKNSVLIKWIFISNLLINLMGGIMHFSILYITIKNRNFHSTCKLLIAANSVCVMLAYLSPITPLIVFVVPNFRPSLFQCFIIQSGPLVANFNIFSLILVIGFDRLLSTFCPIWYMSRNDRFFFFLLLFSSALFPMFIEWIAFKNMTSKPNVERCCTLGELIGGRAFFVGLCCLICIVIALSFYLAVWARIKLGINSSKKGHNENTHASRLSILRSLCIILCLQVGGWTLGQMTYAFVYINAHSLRPLTRWHINSALQAFLSLIAALDVPVLYINSHEYRETLKQIWPWKVIAKCEEEQIRTPMIQTHSNAF